MDLFTFLQQQHEASEKRKQDVEKQIQELKHRLLDSDSIRFGGVFDQLNLKFSRQGGDAELQMLAVLIAYHKITATVSSDWETQGLSRDQCLPRFLAINLLAIEISQK